MRRTAPCFGESFDGSKPYVVMDWGLRVIDTDRIVGTVGKCGEMDTRFRYLRRNDHAESKRRRRIIDGMEEYEAFPPIRVYLLGGDYYVSDGHRRVSACRTLGIQYIDALVKEYLYTEDGRELDGAITKRRFESESGIGSIDLRHKWGYRILLRGATHYPPGGNEGAHRWYSSFFLPFCDAIARSLLVRRYRDIQAADIYVIVVRFYDDFMGGVPKDTGFDTLISGFLFSHNLRRRRPLKSLLLRLLGIAIFRGSSHGRKTAAGR